MESQRRKRETHPYEKASLLSYICFTWPIKIYLRDFKDKLNADNIWKPFSKHRSESLGARLESQWQNQLKKHSNRNSKPSLLIAISKTFWLELSFLAFIHILHHTNDIILRPLFLRSMLDYFTANGTATMSEALEAGTVLLFLSLLSNFLLSHYCLWAFTLGMTIRAACINLVYRKSLRLSLASLRELSLGQIVNLVSNDVSRFDSVIMTWNFLWSTSLISCGVGYSLYNEVGLSGLPGFIIIMIITYCQVFGANLTSRFRARIAYKTDDRIRLTDEILSGIQVLKMYAWEKPYLSTLEKARSLELREILKANMVRGVFMAFGLFTRRIAIFGTLVLYVLLGQHLNSSSVYVTITYYNLLSGVLTGSFARAIGEFAEVRVAMKRLQNFLLLKEVASIEKPKKENEIRSLVEEKGAISIKHVNASWGTGTTDSILSDLTIECNRNQLTMIIGPVASGKTSFIQLILGEMKLLEGKMKVNGTISYSSQDPWIFGGSIQENILLGSPYDEEKYEQVIQVCCLERDLELFENGDQEMVGQRGASLSGGQKARINLARAVYKDADIYLLDDPLSAVDTHVGRSIFENCFKKFLVNKTVVLATHQIQFMEAADYLVLLENGKIESQGKFQDIVNTKHDYLKYSLNSKKVEPKEIPELKEKVDPRRIASLTRLSSICSETTSFVSSIGEMEEEVPPPPVNRDTDLYYKGSPYLGYINIGKNITFPVLFLLTFIAAQLFASFCDYFVTLWVIDEEKGESVLDPEEQSRRSYYNILLYSLLIGALFITVFSRGIFFYLMTNKCSKGFHSTMAKNIVYTNISFFNSNPTGAILNRFTRDLGSVDEPLPKAILDTSQIFGQVIGGVIVTAIVNWYLLIPFMVLAIISFVIRYYSMKTTLNLKRLEGVCRSPVFTHLSSTLQGLVTIRAHGQKFLIEEFNVHQDLHTSAMFSFLGTQQGFVFLLDLINIIYLACVIFFCIVFNGDVYGAEVGLAITQTITITNMLQWGMRQASETASLMTSVERLLAFTNIELEETDTKNKILPPPIWPNKGKVEFRNLSLFYSDSVKALKHVNFIIESGEKVGIVGRTGAGKSTLMQALFRLAKIEGDIVIDDVNTKDITLGILRARISVIPQNPILFSGDIRKNLDPFSDYPDYFLLRILDELEIPEFLSDHALDTKVSDGGSNMSIGQRQLICLVRAILKNSSLVILDEATANVDPNTDRLIQSIIRKKFRECTVLTIAHRLNTIMDSDKVLVMDSGKVVEFNSPHILLQKKRGYFYSLVQETGRDMAADLMLQAKQCYWKKQQEKLNKLE